MSRQYSVVIPVKDEVKKIIQTLPSIYKLNPNEVIICTDKPAPISVIYNIKLIAAEYNMISKTKIIQVERNPKYLYHQANVRRTGFLAAKNDIILTADVDLIINKNILKGLKYVGKNNVGIVTFPKLRYYGFSVKTFLRLTLTSILRLTHRIFFQNIKNGRLFSQFTGLYFLYRPYWLDTEKESIYNLYPPVTKSTTSNVLVGEDAHLKNKMMEKHIVKYIPKIGAQVIAFEYIHDRKFQKLKGKQSAKNNKKILGVLLHTIFYLEGTYFKSYLQERRTKRPNP